MPREDTITEEERRAHTPYDLIRMRLERLEKNIHKPAPIPAKKADIKAPRAPPEFVRNVVGSSAAAGSAEFHIYRNNRKKEQNRLDYISKMAERDDLDEAYKAKREGIEKAEQEKTAKKRAKRLRQKEKAKRARKNKGVKEESSSEDSDEDDSDVETKPEAVNGDSEEKTQQGAAADDTKAEDEPTTAGEDVEKEAGNKEVV